MKDCDVPKVVIAQCEERIGRVARALGALRA
jgi:hypothetical protein